MPLIAAADRLYLVQPKSHKKRWLAGITRNQRFDRGAEDEIRTRDFLLGKEMLYH